MQKRRPDEAVKAVTKRSRQIWAATAAIAALVVLIDQLTKNWALSALNDREIRLFSDVGFTLLFNSGIAFGIGSGIFPLLIALVVIGVLVLMVVRGTALTNTAVVAMGLVLGGAFGNVFDRMFRSHDGAVVDFIKLWSWPVFNMADICVVIGALLLMVITSRNDRVSA